jgi:hypothetical protein
VLHKWDWVKGSIAALNVKLKAAHLPVLDFEQKPQNMPDSGDKD